jgi:hypothetical protein
MGSCGISNDNKYYIQPSEVCAFKALNTLKTNHNKDYYNSNLNTIFSNDFFLKDTNLNKDYRNNQIENNYIYQYNPNKKDLCYNIGQNEWAINCAIQTKNPFYTYDNKNKNCTLIPSLKPNENYSYEQENSSNYITLKLPTDKNNETVYSYKNKKGFCENKWYDWIITPNYHFGNQYEKDVGNFSKEDIRKCYKPCIKGYLPYFNSKNNEYICIPKDEAEDGLFANKLDYSPVALINLIGNIDITLYFYNKLSTDILEANYMNNQYYEINKPKLELKDYEFDKVIEDIKNTLNTYFIDDKSMNARDIERSVNVISYRNPLFDENDPELITLRGMDTNGMMTDEILIHTYYLAYNYNKFYEELIKKENYFNNEDTKFENLNFDKIKKSPNNIRFNLAKYFDYNKDKFQRLANILFKAINICYDEKTDFSRNLLDYTKLAFDKYKINFSGKHTGFDKNNYLQFKNNLNTVKFDEFKKNENYTKTYYYNLDKEVTIQKLEIPYIFSSKNNDNNDNNNNSHLSDYILEKLTDLTDDQKKSIKELYDNKDDVIFYTLEDKERLNKCSTGKIYNKETKICEDCGTYCGKDNKCKTDKNCSYFCKDSCPDTNIKEKTNKCGNVKKTKEIPKEKGKIETPVESNFNMPDFSIILKSAIKIVLVLLFLYMCYIFYQIYGETLFTLYNYIEYTLVMLFAWVKAYFIIRHDAKENYDFMMKEYIRNNAKSKFERVSSKIKAS